MIVVSVVDDTVIAHVIFSSCVLLSVFNNTQIREDTRRPDVLTPLETICMFCFEACFVGMTACQQK